MMRGILHFIVVALILLVQSSNGTVHKITSANIDFFYSTHDLVVLQFTAPWSTQCKEFAPEFEKAAAASYPLGKIGFGVIDAKAEGKLRNLYNVWSYPYVTVRRRDGSLTPYGGRANASAIINFVKRAAFTNHQAVSTPEQIDQFLHLEDVAVLGYFEEDKREYRNFIEITKKLQSKILIGFVNNGSHLQSAYEITPGPASVLIYKRFDNSMLVYKSDFLIRVLANWIVDNTRLPVNFLHPDNAFKYLGFKVPGLLLFLDTLNSSQTTLGQATFQLLLPSSTHKHLTVTVIRNSTVILSPSSPPSDPDSSSNQEIGRTQNSYTTHTISPKDKQQAQDAHSIHGILPETDPVLDVSHYTSALRSEPSKECSGDYLGCLSMLYEMAITNTGKLNFIYTDGVAYKPFLERLGVSKLPSVVILDWSQEKHYIFDPTLPITPSNLNTFFSNFSDNLLRHYIRSAPSSPPSPSSPSPTSLLTGGSRILHVVANDFKELVLNNTKPVLLNIHLPWCGFCKSMWPAYEQLSSIVTDNVIIADFDASINDMPRDFPSSSWPTSFPHITLFPAHDKSNPIPMTKDPSLSHLVEFLVDNISGLEVEAEPLGSRSEDEQSYLKNILENKY